MHVYIKHWLIVIFIARSYYRNKCYTSGIVTPVAVTNTSLLSLRGSLTLCDGTNFLTGTKAGMINLTGPGPEI